MCVRKQIENIPLAASQRRTASCRAHGAQYPSLHRKGFDNVANLRRRLPTVCRQQAALSGQAALLHRERKQHQARRLCCIASPYLRKHARRLCSSAARHHRRMLWARTPRRKRTLLLPFLPLRRTLAPPARVSSGPMSLDYSSLPRWKTEYRLEQKLHSGTDGAVHRALPLRDPLSSECHVLKFTRAPC